MSRAGGHEWLLAGGVHCVRSGQPLVGQGYTFNAYFFLRLHVHSTGSWHCTLVAPRATFVLSSVKGSQRTGDRLSRLHTQAGWLAGWGGGGVVVGGGRRRDGQSVLFVVVVCLLTTTPTDRPVSNVTKTQHSDDECAQLTARSTH